MLKLRKNERNDLYIAVDGTRTRNPIGYKPSALAIELNNSIGTAGKELSLSSWCIASLCLSFLNCG